MINIRNCADGKVTEPGLYRMTAEQYHADPCPEPSLSSSAIKTMLERTPRHAFHDHPRLGGMRLESSSAAQTLGSVVHAMVLGAGREWHVIDADDWRTKAAKAERDAAESVGKVPILRPMFERAEGMAAALSSGLRALPLVDMALALGEPEVVCIWRESVQVGSELVTVWCRSMMDLCPTGIDDDGWLTIYDLKTTQVALDPVTLARKMVSDGNDVQAEWYTRGLLEVLRVPDSAIYPRARFRFLFAESDPPHLCVAVACSGAMESIGAAKVQAGLSLWARCMHTGEWPGYGAGLLRLEPPTFLESQWRDREAGDPLIVGALNNWRNAA